MFSTDSKDSASNHVLMKRPCLLIFLISIEMWEVLPMSVVVHVSKESCCSWSWHVSCYACVFEVKNEVRNLEGCQTIEGRPQPHHRDLGSHRCWIELPLRGLAIRKCQWLWNPMRESTSAVLESIDLISYMATMLEVYIAILPYGEPSRPSHT